MTQDQGRAQNTDVGRSIKTRTLCEELEQAVRSTQRTVHAD